MSQFTADLSAILLRDIDTVIREIEMYPDDASVWGELPGVPNSAGTLALHLAGNLRHFIGAGLGDTGYVRNRDLEFSARGLPRTEILPLLRAAHDEVAATLAKLDPAKLDETYPMPLGERRLPTRLFLLQLAVHLTFHLGQIDYHRRASTTSTEGAGSVSMKGLGTSA